MSLRVVHLNTLLTGGGTDDQCVRLVDGLGRLGVAACLVGPDGREYSRVARALGVSFHPTPPEGWLKLRFMPAAAKWIRRERAQIVHGHHGRDLWPTVIAARLSGVRPRIVVTRHLAKSPGSGFSRRFILGQCDALVACSQFVAKVLREGDADPASPERERHYRPPIQGDQRKIQVIYGGIDTDRFRPLDAAEQRAQWGLKPDDFAFGVVGGYDLPRGKGQREFLRAAARVAPVEPRARFLIVGRGSLASQLQQDIAELGLFGCASLTPYCQDMVAAMNALDCLVHPQIGTEAMPGVVCEAQACGRPVIASALDGIPEAFAIGGWGQLVPPEDVEALAQAMLTWTRHPRADASLRATLHQRVTEQFSLSVAARNYAAFYRRLLGNPD